MRYIVGDYALNTDCYELRQAGTLLPLGPKAFEVLAWRQFPDQKVKRIQNSRARWGFHYFVGIHLLLIPGQWPVTLNLITEQQHLLQLLGDRSARYYR